MMIVAINLFLSFTSAFNNSSDKSTPYTSSSKRLCSYIDKKHFWNTKYNILTTTQYIIEYFTNVISPSITMIRIMKGDAKWMLRIQVPRFFSDTLIYKICFIYLPFLLYISKQYITKVIHIIFTHTEFILSIGAFGSIVPKIISKMYGS